MGRLTVAEVGAPIGSPTLLVPCSGGSSLSKVAALSQTLAHRYRLERELGRAGMGTVSLARDTQLDRHMALKVLPPEYAGVPVLRERFLRETRLAASFSHPNIVPVFTIEEHANVLVFAMDFVGGESLAARVAREEPLSQRALVMDFGAARAITPVRDDGASQRRPAMRRVGRFRRAPNYGVASPVSTGVSGWLPHSVQLPS